MSKPLEELLEETQNISGTLRLLEHPLDWKLTADLLDEMSERLTDFNKEKETYRESLRNIQSLIQQQQTGGTQILEALAIIRTVL
jgi:hypothetical protein